MEFERQGVALLRLDALQRVHHLHGDLGDGGKAEEGGQHGILLFGLQDDGFNCVHQNAVRVASNQLIFATVDAANHPSQGWIVGTQAIDDRIGGNRGLHLQIVNGGVGSSSSLRLSIRCRCSLSSSLQYQIRHTKYVNGLELLFGSQVAHSG